MRYEYVVTLRKNAAKLVELGCFLACLFSAVSFLIVQVRGQWVNWALLAAAAALIAGLAINTAASYRGKPGGYRIWLFIAGVGWLAMPFLRWLIVPLCGLAFFEHQARRPLEIGFSAMGIVVNGIIKKRYAWNQLNAVILKDGILTIDFRDNRLLQQEVLDDDESDAEEDEFNAWCTQRFSHPSQEP